MPILTIHAQAPMAVVSGRIIRVDISMHMADVSSTIKELTTGMVRVVRQETHCIVLWASVAIHRKTYRTGRTKE